MKKKNPQVYAAKTHLQYTVIRWLKKGGRERYSMPTIAKRNLA